MRPAYLQKYIIIVCSILLLSLFYIFSPSYHVLKANLFDQPLYFVPSSPTTFTKPTYQTFNTFTIAGTHPGSTPPISFQETGQKQVILLTSYRSGSTFVGEIFNRHPDIFYHFEPLVAFDESDNKGENAIYIDPEHRHQYVCQNPVEKVDHINRLFACKVPKWGWRSPDTVLKTRFDGQVQKLTPMTTKGSCAGFGYCFRYKTKKLCNPPFCDTGATTEKECSKTCPWVKNDMAVETCEKSKAVVLKIIRFCDGNLLLPLFELYDNLAVIVQVRDPRGTFLSRVARNPRHPPEEFLLSVKTTCESAVLNHHAYRSKPDKFKIIRYEDVAYDPQTWARRIHEFAGIEFNQEVDDWIEENTNIQGLNPYGSTRNSSKTAENWRNLVNDKFLKMIFTVEEYCGGMMEIYGYRKIESRKMLTDFDVSFVLDVEF